MSTDDEDTGQLIHFPGNGDDSYVPPPIPSYSDTLPLPDDTAQSPSEPPDDTTMDVPPVLTPMTPAAALNSYRIPPPEPRTGNRDSSNGVYVPSRSLADRIGDWIEHRMELTRTRHESEKPLRHAEIARKTALLKARTQHEVAMVEQNGKLRQAHLQAKGDKAAARGKADAGQLKYSGMSADKKRSKNPDSWRNESGANRSAPQKTNPSSDKERTPSKKSDPKEAPEGKRNPSKKSDPKDAPKSAPKAPDRASDGRKGPSGASGRGGDSKGRDKGADGSKGQSDGKDSRPRNDQKNKNNGKGRGETGRDETGRDDRRTDDHPKDRFRKKTTKPPKNANDPKGPGAAEGPGRTSRPNEPEGPPGKTNGPSDDPRQGDGGQEEGGPSTGERLRDRWRKARERRSTTQDGPTGPVSADSVGITIERDTRPTGPHPGADPDPAGGITAGQRGLPRAPESHHPRPGTSRPTGQENSVSNTTPTPASTSAQPGLAAQHRTDITFGEYVVDMTNIAISAGLDKEHADALAEALDKVAKALHEMATDLTSDHNIDKRVVGLVTDLANAAGRMKNQAQRCSGDCDAAYEAAKLAARAVVRVYGQDMDTIRDSGLTYGSSAAHHD